mgnify:CR=1 FL=1|jgi:Dehydrogenases (flavoproteins)
MSVSPPPSSPAPSTASRAGSVFDEVFDVVIVGAGYLGLGAEEAARALRLRVLVIEPSGQPLWESTRALETKLAGGAADGPWSDWLAPLRERGGADETHLDPCFAEIQVQRMWSDDAASIARLFYAMPVRVTHADGVVTALKLATKSGCRTVRARRWIDATENGLLAKLLLPGQTLSSRAPSELRHRLVLQSMCWYPEEIAALSAFAPEDSGHLETARRSTERRLVWSANAARPWHAEMTTRLRRLRGLLPLPSNVIVSQCSAEPFPVYSANTVSAPIVPTPANLLLLSPAFGNAAVDSLAARFEHGHAQALEFVSRTKDLSPPDVALTSELAAVETKPVREIVGEVLVAGAGTAGALAAISSARAGARTCAVDFASFPGGVGTGGGITGYFHGLEGGLQTESDRLTRELNLLLEGRELASRRWHHEGKKLALLALFESHGVAFHGGSLLCEIEKDDRGRVCSALIATPEGPVRFRAEAFVDCTGDGDLCAFAGASYAFGREGDGRPLAYSQSAFVLKTESDGPVVFSCNFDSGWTDPTDVEDLTRARVEGVLQHERPRWDERTCPLAIAPLPGVRQSRQIDTDLTLSFRDVVDHARFADCIGEACSVADTHSVDFEFEDDEALFFFWVCRLFRHPLRVQLPYRMLLPRGLKNVWVACRAAGVSVNAAYAVRMQRDMQRLGEVAGRAAALAARAGLGSRQVPVAALVDSRATTPSPSDEPSSASLPELLDALAGGRPGPHLWRLYRRAPRPCAELSALLRSGAASPFASFYAAAILAMWDDPAAEPRLLEAVVAREDGPPPTPESSGAHGQEIDAPFWLIAVTLLRRCGTRRSVPVLRELAADANHLLNIRTAVGLTIERLAARGVLAPDEAADLAELLIRHPLPDPVLPPSRSIWRTLRRESQIVLRNDVGAPTQQDHAWQLHLVVARIRVAAGRPLHAAAEKALRDPRAHVARAFVGLAPRGRTRRPDTRELVA